MINYVIVGENSFDTFRSIFSLFNFRLISRSEKKPNLLQEQRSLYKKTIHLYISKVYFSTN